MRQYYVMSEEEKKEVIADALKLKGSIIQRARILFPRYQCSMRVLQTIIAPNVPDRTKNLRLDENSIKEIQSLFKESEFEIFGHKLKDVSKKTGRSISVIRNIVLKKVDTKPNKSTALFDHKQEMF